LNGGLWTWHGIPEEQRYEEKDVAHIVELAGKWSEQRHAELAYLAEVVDECYPNSPAESDPWRIRVEKALVRRADGPWPLTAEEAADYLEERVTARFPHMDEWQVDWREVRGVRGLRILWGWGPSWLPVRAYAITSQPCAWRASTPLWRLQERSR
jgi:hypothetical protein